MPSFRPRLLIFLGVILLLLAFFICIPPSAHAQTTQPAEYVGSSSCASCHKERARNHDLSRHAMALRDVSSDKKAITADFSAGGAERMVKFPNEANARPFTADDITYVIGAGSHVERYLYRVDRNTYMLLPAEWRPSLKSWSRIDRGKDWPGTAYDWTTNCAGCHTTGLNAARGRWVDDGVQCEACHGPGSIHADLAQKAGDNPTAADLQAIRAATMVSADAQVCGQCHSAGTEPGKGLPYPVKYTPGAALLASDTFALVAPKDSAHWGRTGHASQPNMQFNEWVLSGHGKDLQALKGDPKADTSCLSCHSADARLQQAMTDAQKSGERKGDAPPPLTVQAAKSGITCISCHDPHSKEEGAKLPVNLVSDTYTLCASCHNSGGLGTSHHPVQEIFEGKPIVPEVKPFGSNHFFLKAGPKCTTCHMAKVLVDGVKVGSHLQNSITSGVIDESLVRTACVGCHMNNSPSLMQRFVQDTQNKVKSRVKAARAALKPDSHAWVRTVLDAIESDGSWGLHNPRYVTNMLSAVEKDLGLSK